MEVSCEVDMSQGQVLYSLTSDRQPVIYWATIHSLARIYFDSNTQEMLKKQMYLSDFHSFLPMHEETPPTALTVKQVFICML